MSYSSTVYKFRTWSQKYHRDTLIKNELFYASPSEINDPFDFKITVDYSLLDTFEKREKYIDKLLNQTIDVLIERGIDPILKKRELIWRLEHDTENMQLEFDSTNSKWTENRFGVISFSQRWDSILMWSHYSENHKGFCIGFNRKMIEESNIFGSAGGVKYSNIYPSIDPNNDEPLKELIIKTHTKAQEWQYEEEYRIIQIWDEASPTISDRKITIPQDFIEEVILGKLISEKDKLEILKITLERKIPTYIISQKPRTFLLQKTQLT